MYSKRRFPSSHSSTVTALSISIGLSEGFDSALFAITCVFSFIVVYDAANVRYYAGKNIQLTKQLISEFGRNERLKIFRSYLSGKIEKCTWT